MPTNLISDEAKKDLAARAAGMDKDKGDTRTKAVTAQLLYRIMQVIDECDVSMDEFWAAVAFIGKAAKNDELGLLVPGIVLEHFLDLRLDEAEKLAGLKGGTLRTIEGPLYVPGAPLSKGEARMDDGTDKARSSSSKVRFRMRTATRSPAQSSTSGTPIRKAAIPSSMASRRPTTCAAASKRMSRAAIAPARLCRTAMAARPKARRAS